MEINEKKLQHIYEKWSTKELLKGVTVDKDNYDPVAIDIMNKELKKRDVNNGNKEEFQKTCSQEKQTAINSGTPFCPKCYSLNIKKQKPWWVFFLLYSPLVLVGLLVFLLIPKYLCLECGYQFRDGKIGNRTTGIKK